MFHRKICVPMEKNYVSGLGTCVHTEKALFEAWGRQTAEMAGLRTAFQCVPADLKFEPCLNAFSLLARSVDEILIGRVCKTAEKLAA